MCAAVYRFRKLSKTIDSNDQQVKQSFFEIGDIYMEKNAFPVIWSSSIQITYKISKEKAITLKQKITKYLFLYKL